MSSSAVSPQQSGRLQQGGICPTPTRWHTLHHAAVSSQPCRPTRLSRATCEPAKPVRSKSASAAPFSTPQAHT
ncbi:hypothetical protein WJX73_007049 [Symbiochloris irregularis]|uniref:Uncharacterized protein n=1 Tax=Symbiochloris irregularis TaxID=706552 RepID=A0AAW1PHQ7_9CHLO